MKKWTGTVLGGPPGGAWVVPFEVEASNLRTAVVRALEQGARAYGSRDRPRLPPKREPIMISIQRQT